MSHNAPTRMNWNGKTLFRPPHQNGACDSTVPKYHYVPPQAGSAQGAWRTSGHFLDFKIPNQIGTIYALNWRFLVNVVAEAPDASGVVAPTNAPPTPFWINQIEVSVGSTLIETIYSQDIYNETIGFLPIDQLTAQAEALSYHGVLSEDGRNVSSDATLSAGDNTHYLPFNSALTTARLYAAGIAEDIKLRVYFPPGLFGSLVTLSDLTLVVEEDIGSSDDAAAWHESHKQGIVYNTLVRQRQSQMVSRVVGNSNTIDLTGLNGSSAGLLVYSGDGALPTKNTDLLVRYPIKEITLQDQMGNKKTEVLQATWLKSFVWPDHIGTYFAAQQEAYLIPFSADFRKAVEDGINCGAVKMDGTDRLVIGPAVSTRVESVTITNYSYQSFVFVRGKLVSVIKRY